MAILESVHEYVGALEQKQQSKAALKEMSAGDEGFVAARSNFLAADDRCEALLQQIVRDFNDARTDDTLEDALDALSEAQLATLHAQFSERGLLHLIEANNDGLGGIIRKYRKSGSFFTAVQEINSLRRALEPAELQSRLEQSPANIDGKAWTRAVTALRNEVSALQAEYPEAEAEDILREAAFSVERRARCEYDQIGEQLVSVMQDLIASGRFDAAVAQLAPEQRKAARDLCAHVPQPQVQVQPKRESRAVALAEPETETDDLIDEIESWLQDQ